MFSVQQIDSLLDILKHQNLVFIGKQLGLDYLTKEEVQRLQFHGINPYNFYKPEGDNILMAFHFGLISDAIGIKDAKDVTFENLKQYFQKGEFIPLTERERNVISSIKKQTLSDIKSLEGKIFKDVNNIISSEEKNNRVAYEKVIRETVERGRVKRQTVKQIARELAIKTGDWNRNFERIVNFVTHQAFDEGRAALYERQHGENVLVYKDVFNGACKYCIKLYLTSGFGSEPIVFKLKDLKANGTNIGRKQQDWLPVIGATHPHCRCHLSLYERGLEWSKEKRTYSFKENFIPNKQLRIEDQRPKVKVTLTIGNRVKEYSV